MNVSTEMLQAAMKKASEAGLLPRHMRDEEVLMNQDLVRAVVQAALDAALVERNRRLPVAAPILPPAPGRLQEEQQEHRRFIYSDADPIPVF